jgi:hypothetical protein
MTPHRRPASWTSMSTAGGRRAPGTGVAGIGIAAAEGAWMLAGSRSLYPTPKNLDSFAARRRRAHAVIATLDDEESTDLRREWVDRSDVEPVVLARFNDALSTAGKEVLFDRGDRGGRSSMEGTRWAGMARVSTAKERMEPE